MRWVLMGAQKCWPSWAGPWNKGVCRPGGGRLGTRGQREWGHGGRGGRPRPERRVPRKGTRQPPQPRLRPPGGPSARHSWPLCHNPQPLCPLTAPKTGAAQKYGCRGEKQTQRPSVPSWRCLPPARSRGHAFGPGVTAAASPLPSPKQARPLRAYHPSPHPRARTGNGGLETRDFPTAQPGLGVLPHGLCTQADRRDPGQETPDTLCLLAGSQGCHHGPGTGRPVQLLPGSTGLTEGLPNGCVRLSAPQTHQGPHPEGQGLGSSTCSPL